MAAHTSNRLCTSWNFEAQISNADARPLGGRFVGVSSIGLRLGTLNRSRSGLDNPSSNPNIIAVSSADLWKPLCQELWR